MPEAEAATDHGVPWIRLAGALLIGFALVELAEQATVAMLLARAKQAELAISSGSIDISFEAFERRDEAYHLLDLSSTSNLGTAIAGGWCTALVLVVAAWRATRPRALVGLAALAFASSTSYALHLFARRFFSEGPPVEPSHAWHATYVVADLVAVGLGTALVVLRSRGLPRRNVALACVLVAAAAALLRFGVSPLAYGGEPPSWWRAPVLGLGLFSWTGLVVAVGLGAGLWLATSPTSDAHHRSFDRAAARGLRWARTAVWWRVGLAVGGAAFLLFGAAAQRRAQQQAIFVGGSDSTPSSSSWMLDLASWLGLAEIALGMLLVVGLGATVLQRRSLLAAMLTGIGALILLAGAMGSLALDRAVHDALQSNTMGTIWGGGDVRDQARLALEHESTIRVLGLLGLGTTLAGLVVLARTLGRTPKRAVRFFLLALLFAAVWQWGREPLAELGMVLLLLAPVVLAAAVWMLLDLVTFLGEVAEALEAEAPSL